MKSFDVSDFIVLVGLAAMLAGIALMHVPTALIVGGVVVVFCGLLASKRT